mgnify:CR=1 FL=1
MRKTLVYICGTIVILCFGGFCLMGCAVSKGKSLLVTSETVIGLKIGTNPDTQIPEVKFGYIRSEGAIVPVKGSETASVLARLNFDSVWTSNAGISSIIATGQAAESESIKRIIDNVK